MRDNAPAHLRHVISETAPNDRPNDDLCLPALGSGDYQPFSRPSFKSLFAIHFITPQATVRSFQYVHMGDSSFLGQQIILQFMGSRIVNVLIEGRNLWALYDYLHQHRIAWVKAATRDFSKDKQAIVTNISIVDAQETSTIAS